MKQQTDSKCRVWYKTEEHIKHITGGYTTIEPSAYTNRNNESGWVYPLGNMQRYGVTSHSQVLWKYIWKGYECQQYRCYVVRTENWKTKQVQRPGDRGQQDVESEDKNCASYKWSIRNN